MNVKLHHVAYRCRDARETADFYTKVLGLPLAHVIRSETYRDEHCPFLHLFFRLSDGSFLAFFELPEELPQGWDLQTPRWVQHLALQMPDMESLTAAKRHLEAQGLEVTMRDGDTTITSIYFFDPNGHRLELCVARELDHGALESRAEAALDEWQGDKGRYHCKSPG